MEAARWARLRVGEELVYEWPPAKLVGGPGAARGAQAAGRQPRSAASRTAAERQAGAPAADDPDLSPAAWSVTYPVMGDELLPA